MAEMPVAQTAVQNGGHIPASQYGIATGYHSQAAHGVLIRPKPAPIIPQADSDDRDDEPIPIPKRKRVQREGPPRLPPFLREMQADARKRQAELLAAQARAANPQSTVDLTNGMDRLLHCLQPLLLLSFANFVELVS